MHTMVPKNKTKWASEKREMCYAMSHLVLWLWVHHGTAIVYLIRVIPIFIEMITVQWC